MNRTLGIIGGMGPLATANLFNKIVLKTEAKSDQDHIHILIDNNIAIPDRTAYLVGDGDNPLEELVKSAKRLENMGADFLIMPCNTAHYFYQEIKDVINIAFLNMIEETVMHIKEKYPTSKKVGLLATDGTVQSKIYDLYFNKENIEMINLDENSQKSIMNIIYSVKAGKNQIPLEDIYSAIDELKGKGADVVILGCTELSVVNEKHDLKGNIVDALNIITETAIQFAGKKVASK
ncbi:cysteate racemase [Alkaliphilus oremlandii]|uniref:Aspartate racemase n=1 Tax=Alkaliphilus oremlandii (strain OhILAs) TaxID=350688 RepID=A8MLJ5_ALKOO|nr:amino acid racemase [Alkaliphilus oremlandii]ABW18109.1 aspartate racemase [Alkaliphilus oremlandii OhILAs]